jgi:hypothetical protein
MGGAMPKFQTKLGQALRIRVTGDYIVKDSQAVAYASAYLRDSNERNWVFQKAEGESGNFTVTYVRFW